MRYSLIEDFEKNEICENELQYLLELEFPIVKKVSEYEDKVYYSKEKRIWFKREKKGNKYTYLFGYNYGSDNDLNIGFPLLVLSFSTINPLRHDTNAYFVFDNVTGESRVVMSKNFHNRSFEKIYVDLIRHTDSKAIEGLRKKSVDIGSLSDVKEIYHNIEVLVDALEYVYFPSGFNGFLSSIEPGVHEAPRFVRIRPVHKSSKTVSNPKKTVAKDVEKKTELKYGSTTYTKQKNDDGFNAVTKEINMLLQNNRLNEALYSINKAIYDHPKKESLYVKKATVLLMIGQYEEALTAISHVSHTKNNYLYHFTMGLVLLNLKRPGDALNSFNMASDIKGTDKELRFYKAKAFYDLEYYQNAIDLCVKYFDENPDNDDAWVLMGDCYMGLEKLDDAIECFQRAIEINPKSTETARKRKFAKNKKMAIEIKAKNAEAAQKRKFAKNKKRDLNNTNNLEKLNHVKKSSPIKKKNKNSPEKKLEKSIKKTFKGDSLFEEGRYELALKEYERAIKSYKANDHAWAGKANCLINLDKYIDALPAIQKALELNPENENALLAKGIYNNHRENFEESLEIFHKVTEINNNNVEAWTLKSLALSDLNRYDEALDAIEHALKIDSNYEFANYVKSQLIDNESDNLDE